MRLLYKYRSLDPFRFFIDILRNKELYAAQFTELNDPMEGVFTLSRGVISEEMRSKIHYKKLEYRICAFSNKMNSTLMWTHYSDSHRGVVVGIEPPQENRDTMLVEVNYVTKLKVSGDTHSARNIAQEILSQKLDHWKYEDEMRILTTKKFVPIKISQVIIGCNADRNEVERIKFMFKGVVDKSRIRQLDRSELDTSEIA